MTNLRKAAEMALEVLETTWGDGSEDALKEWKEATQALHHALAEPKREWVGLSVNEARDFYQKYTNREQLIYAIDEFLEEKNG